MKYLYAIAVGLLSFATAASQPVDTLLTGVKTLARFQDARALGVDSYGLLYVIDAGDAAIHQLDATGAVLARMGGPGKGDYEFDDPSDIDPSTGVVLLVADAGNNRVKRFSREFLHLESLSLDVSSFAVAQAAGRGGFREDDGSPLEYAAGRPIAVAGTLSDEMYAIDEDQGVVVKWNPSGDIEHVFGGHRDGAGALREPVALTVDVEGNVYVGDRGHKAVLVFDRFGAYVRRLADGHASTITGLASFRGGVIAVLEDRILVYDLTGGLSRTIALDVKGPLVDAAVLKDALYVLLPDRLLVTHP